MKAIYIFLDEGGNFDFSSSGTAYFTLTSVTRSRPFLLNPVLDDYKYDLMEYGQDRQCFHCSEDNEHVRREVFGRILAHHNSLSIDSLVVNKRKTGPALRAHDRFYPEMFGYLLRYVLEREATREIDEVIIVTDTIPIKRKRQAIEKAVKRVLAEKLPKDMKFRVLHHDSRAHYGLQIADYCNWAMLRKWERGETKYYDQIAPMIRSEFDIFRSGTIQYY